MANRYDARANRVRGDGARVRGDALVDAAVYLRMDFIFNLPGSDAQARRGPGGLIQIVCLVTFYGVVFGPQEIGWNAAASFDGGAIAFGVIVLFDNWLWPDPGEPILMESLGASVARARSQLLGASNFFLAGESVPRPPLPAPTSDLPAHMALLNQALAEGASEHRRAILLAAITRAARISFEMDRLITTAREPLSREIRTMVRGEIQSAVNAIAAALDEISHKLPARIAVGADEQAPATRTHLRSGDGQSGRARR